MGKVSGGAPTTIEVNTKHIKGKQRSMIGSRGNEWVFEEL